MENNNAYQCNDSFLKPEKFHELLEEVISAKEKIENLRRDDSLVFPFLQIFMLVVYNISIHNIFCLYCN